MPLFQENGKIVWRQEDDDPDDDDLRELADLLELEEGNLKDTGLVKVDVSSVVPTLAGVINAQSSIGEWHEENYSHLLFWQNVYSCGFSYVAYRKWNFINGDFEKLFTLGKVVSFTDHPTSKTLFIIQDDGTHIMFYTRPTRASLVIARLTYSPEVESILTVFKDAFNESKDDSKKSEVSISFCSASAIEDYDVRKRTIKVPSWEDIKSNYPSNSRAELDKLINFKPEAFGGHLVIFNGDPGTGKTFFLRSIIHEWQTWCNTFYVTDPEQFFNSSAYMLGVIADTESRYSTPDDDEDNEDTNWRLLVMEDAGDLIVENATMHTARNELSRFLNLVDGIIGQGMKTIVIITSNEPINKLHPAVSRDGRSVAILDFKKFSKDEANEWLKNQGSQDQVTGERSLAELFSVAQGKQQVKPSRSPSLGFR